MKQDLKSLHFGEVFEKMFFISNNMPQWTLNICYVTYKTVPLLIEDWAR